MCMAIPGKIIEINKNKAKVDYGSEVREVGLLDSKFKVGDYVLVQNKVIIEKVEKKKAEEFLRLIKDD